MNFSIYRLYSLSKEVFGFVLLGFAETRAADSCLESWKLSGKVSQSDFVAQRTMDYQTPQFVSSRQMRMYEPINQISMWENFKVNGCQDASASMILEVVTKLDNQSEDSSHGIPGPSNKFQREASKPSDKVLRRLAQNREAARKSRLRKKAYVQQLETSRLKLNQLEQELEQSRQQDLFVDGGLDTSHLGCSANANSGIATFEMEYEHWVKEENRRIHELRTALNSDMVDKELRILVDGSMNHYFDLFRMKATAAKADVFYLMYGTWRTSAECFFSWIGGFRPSKLLKVLEPQLDMLTDPQLFEIYYLGQSCQQAEDALSQGMDRLHQIAAETVAAGQLGEGSYNILQVTSAMDKLEALVSFVNQADHLRQEALQQMHHILTTRQAAQGLLTLGEYSQRLRTLGSLCATRPCEPS